MSARIELDPQPEYVYLTIPAEYVCVYHKILAMMADYGEDMLKDCKASCTDRNSSVIECYNMFNAACAARAIGKTKLSETVIYYIKSKINQIYKGTENNPGYVFPIDEQGRIKAFVSCNDRPQFFINAEDGVLYKKIRGLGTNEEFKFSDIDYPAEEGHHIPVEPPVQSPFDCLINAAISSTGVLTVERTYYLNGEVIQDEYGINEDWYFDAVAFENASEVTGMDYGQHLVVVVAEYGEYLITKECIVTRHLTD